MSRSTRSVPGSLPNRGAANTRGLGRALAIALAVHGAGLAWVAQTWERDVRIATVAGGDDIAETGLPSDVELATVELWDDGQVGALQPVFDGAGDESSADSVHPFPSADVDTPGTMAAASGSGHSAGTESVTGRNDADSARAQMWNHPNRYRLARSKSGAQTSTPESIVRQRDTGISDRAPRRARARVGQTVSSAGQADATGALDSAGLPSRDWKDAEPSPALDDPRAVARQVRGATRVGSREKLAERGAGATESVRRGPARDRIETAGASDERDPAPIELSSPSAGGSGAAGVRAESEQSGASRRARGSGSAATRATVPRGRGRLAVRARRQNAYFRRMYERVDERLTYPKDLALALEQGTVVVRFTLHQNGKIADVSVTKSSGFKGFDRAFIKALRRAAPFGKVPASVRGSADKITVKAPYTFSNPLIR